MKATLVVEGKEFPIEINDPELQKLVAPKKKTGYERVKHDETMFYQHSDGLASLGLNVAQDVYYDVANYYSSKIVAENNARADKLMRQLRRFAVENRISDLNWNVPEQTKWAIHYNRIKEKLEPVDACNSRDFGTIYFDLALHARQAIAAFYDELIWYFTEYKDSI